MNTIRAALLAAVNEAQFEKQSEALKDYERWMAWVKANGKGLTHYDKVKSLGGMQAALRSFRADAVLL